MLSPPPKLSSANVIVASAIRYVDVYGHRIITKMVTPFTKLGTGTVRVQTVEEFNAIRAFTSLIRQPASPNCVYTIGDAAQNVSM